jgi:hypothetical protein
MQKYAASVADDLLEEGLTFTDQEFYEKLDEEMKTRFPEKFSDEDVVQSRNTPSSRRQDVSNKRQPVASGSNRPPVAQKGREVLTREEAAKADAFGIPRERWAARKKAQREAAESGGWVTIKK